MDRTIAIACSAALAGALTAAAATQVNWTGSAGDRDIANPANWNGNILPVSPDYDAYFITDAGADAPLILSSASSLNPYAIQIKANLVFDLGAGNSLLAANRVFFNIQRAVTIKSGIFGVDWDSAAGDRFFLGDNTADNGVMTVDGPNAVLSSSYKSNIQVGTNMRGYTLNVLNGGTLRGNVTLGQTSAKASGNTLLIRGPGSSQLVPDNGTTAAVRVGNTGSDNTYILTNQAALTVLSGKEINIGDYYTSNIVGSNNWMLVRDRSTVTTGGKVSVGTYSCINGLEVSGGSTVDCYSFWIGESWDNGRLPGYTSCSNSVLVSGDGSRLSARLGYAGHYHTFGNSMRVADGADAFFQDLYVGKGTTSNNVVTVEDGAGLHLLNGTGYIGDQNTTAGNSLVVDGGSLTVTNADSRHSFYVGNNGRGNSLEVTGGGDLFMTNVFLLVGYNTTAVGNTLKIGEGSSAELKDMRIEVGCQSGANGNRLVVDGGDFSLENRVPVADENNISIVVGRGGCDNSLELIDGATMFSTNARIRVGANTGATNNVIALRNGAKWTHLADGAFRDNYSLPKESLTIGVSGSGSGLLVDGSTLIATNDLLFVGQNVSASNCWCRIVNGSTVELYRCVLGNNAGKASVEISDSRVVLHRGAMQVGNNGDYSFGHSLLLSGTNTCLEVGTDGFNISGDSSITFQIDKEPFQIPAGSAVIVTPKRLTTANNVSAEHPYTIRIDASRNRSGGTFTLMKCLDQDFDFGANVVWDYDPAHVELILRPSEVIAHVKNREGTRLMVW